MANECCNTGNIDNCSQLLWKFTLLPDNCLIVPELTL